MTSKGGGRMAALNKTSGQSYYEMMPATDLNVGDVWKDLPVFGHLRRVVCGGLVITPACDLSNNKVETVTYLPIIPVKEYMLGRGFSVELSRVVRSQASFVGLNVEAWQLRGISLPVSSEMRRSL